jgi:hypothetical protein
LFYENRDLVELKVSQGFTSLELVPMAISLNAFCDILKECIMRHDSENKIFLTRQSFTDSAVTAHVSKEKQVWIWNFLKMILDTDKLIYFPAEFSEHHLGYTKQQVVGNPDICAFPGWSVCLAEQDAFLAGKGQGIVRGERQRPEIGLKPEEYLKLLEEQAYFGETGRTAEDFIARFIMRLESTGEVSNDRSDDNAMWLLGNYVKHVKHLKSDLVPTGWWHRDYGRLRLDAHRPGNKACTQSWGMSTVVRLHERVEF